MRATPTRPSAAPERRVMGNPIGSRSDLVVIAACRVGYCLDLAQERRVVAERVGERAMTRRKKFDSFMQIVVPEQVAVSFGNIGLRQARATPVAPIACLEATQ